MKRYISIAVILLASCVPAFPASISFIIGSVKVKSASSWKDAEPGTKISKGDTIKTMNKSLAIVDLDNGSAIKLYPATTFTYGSGAGVHDLSRGTVFAKIGKTAAGNGFSIRHQTVVASVRGTLFYFALHRKLLKSDDLWICVNEGSIDVRETARNKSVTVKEGEGILVKGATDVTPPKVYEWTKKLTWNMDPSKGPVIDQRVLKGDDFPPVY
jgi:ferric-dicitrate binding protein FerR (iron transport regulator)